MPTKPRKLHGSAVGQPSSSGVPSMFSHTIDDTNKLGNKKFAPKKKYIKPDLDIGGKIVGKDAGLEGLGDVITKVKRESVTVPSGAVRKHKMVKQLSNRFISDSSDHSSQKASNFKSKSSSKGGYRYASSPNRGGKEKKKINILALVDDAIEDGPTTEAKEKAAAQKAAESAPIPKKKKRQSQPNETDGEHDDDDEDEEEDPASADHGRGESQTTENGTQPTNVTAGVPAMFASTAKSSGGVPAWKARLKAQGKVLPEPKKEIQPKKKPTPAPKPEPEAEHVAPSKKKSVPEPDDDDTSVSISLSSSDASEARSDNAPDEIPKEITASSLPPSEIPREVEAVNTPSELLTPAKEPEPEPTESSPAPVPAPTPTPVPEEQTGPESDAPSAASDDTNDAANHSARMKSGEPSKETEASAVKSKRRDDHSYQESVLSLPKINYPSKKPAKSSAANPPLLSASSHANRSALMELGVSGLRYQIAVVSKRLEEFDTEAELNAMKKEIKTTQEKLKVEFNKKIQAQKKVNEKADKAHQKIMDEEKKIVENLREENRKLRATKERLPKQMAEVYASSKSLEKANEEIKEHHGQLSKFAKKLEADHYRLEMSSKQCKEQYLPRYRQELYERQQYLDTETRIKNLYRNCMLKIFKHVEKSKQLSVIEEINQIVLDVEEEVNPKFDPKHLFSDSSASGSDGSSSDSDSSSSDSSDSDSD